MGSIQMSRHEGVLESNFMQVLSGTKHVFLFDQPKLVPVYIEKIGGFNTVYHDLGQRAGHEVYEFEASKFTEQHVLERLLDATLVHSETAGKFKDARSNFQELCDLMRAERSGLIIIHNADKLSSEAFSLLARLGNYLRKNHMKWKVLIFANKKILGKTTIAKLGIDEFYSQSLVGPILQKSSTPEVKVKVKPFTYGDILARLAIALGILILVLIFVI